MDEVAGREMLERAVMLKTQSEETEKQIDFVNEQIAELEQFSSGLETLDENSEKEILVNLGRGVFAKAERKENEKLFVEVGSGVVVRKTPKEAREVINEQIIKFKEAKIQLMAQLQEQAGEFREMLKEVEGLKK